ncbi:MAG: M13 family metallopeptidase [Crocinitomicaceae bacterium]|jgi:putative endopeptidase|tara:strand:- start:39175 stop:41190 length:2016 start_codon:yes stop_codon:yes gene_type:complete
MMKHTLKLTAIFMLSLTYSWGQSATVDLSYMNKNIKPTEDFFMFSNGTWVDNNEIPASESRWGSFNELDKANKIKLKAILDKCSASKTIKGSDNQLLGDFYTSFLDMDQRNSQGFSEIKPYLNTLSQIKNFEQLIVFLAKIHREGISPLFGFGVGQDLKDVETNVFYLSQGGIGLPNKEYYTSKDKKDILKKYSEFIDETFKHYSYGKVDFPLKSEQLILFETALAETMFAPSELRIPENTYNKMSIAEVNKTMAPFDFSFFLEKLKVEIPDSVILSTPKFFSNIGAMVENFSIETWKDYFGWNLMRTASPYMDQNLIDLHFDFYGTILSGKKELKEIQDRAIEEITSSVLSEVLGKAFVKEHFSREAKAKVNDMVDNLLSVFRNRINGLDWMSLTTKKEALIKLNAIGRKLGYPDAWKDYSSLNISRDSYFQNIIELNRYAIADNFSDINKPVDKEEWGMPAHMVNAYYHPLLNEIAFPAGIMQPPFFDEQAEDAVNYGRIGMVIGHEFTHGFDDMGSKFAADGSFRNWWTEEDRKSFEDKTKTLGETYATFCPIEDNCVNPDLTMGENIADLGGLTMAYHAYTLTKEYKTGEVRSGYSPAQRFFISYAQLWKIKYTDEEMKNRIANDSHSPGMYRVNGPLMNCPEFFEAFNVKESDKMRNVKGKVSKIW